MALETATYINGLVSSNPPGTDQIAQADDHLRLIKGTLLATFPSITGAVTATHSAINTAAANPIAGTTAAADTLPYYTGTSTAATTAFTSFGRAFVGQTSVANMVSYLGLTNAALTNVSSTFTAAQWISTGATQTNLTLTNTTGNPFHINFQVSGVSKGYLGANATYAFYASNASGVNPIYADQSGNFVATGNVTSASDARLKTNIETISDALDIVDDLRGVWYTRKDSGTERVGVIAQEVAQVLPEVVLENQDTGILSVSYGDIVGVLIEAIKELRSELVATQVRVAELEAL